MSLYTFITSTSSRSVLIIAAGLSFLLALPAAFAATPILPVKEVKPGLTGECHTVFSGTKIDKFHFRVEGIGWDNVGPGRDTIWCRMLDDPTGAMVIAAGMSGSPCYVDGKLMGALAYGWTFNKDPIFGVQPIESMMEVQKDYGQPAPKRLFGRNREGYEAKQVSVDSSKTGAVSRGFSIMAMENPVLCLLSPRPEFELPLPVQMGRLNPLVSEKITANWRKSGLFPLQGVAGNARRKFKAGLVPGATAAGVLARGDFTAAATGTLTWREGDRVLAFGHPFTGRGRVEIPLAVSEIISVVSSYERSFKMANLGEIEGTITHDRISAVAGRVGPKPKMIPMTVKIKYPAQSREFKLEFINDRVFAPLVYKSALMDFLAQVIEQTADATIQIKGTIEVKNFPPVKFQRLFSGENYAWVADLLLDNGQEMSVLYNNEIREFKIESVAVEVEVEPVYRSLIIERVEAYPAEVKPGGNVEGWVTLRPSREEKKMVPFKIKIPEEVKFGEVEILVMDAKSADQAEGRYLGFNTVKPVTPEELISALNDRHEQGRLYFYLSQNTPGLVVQNERLSGLPGSVRELLDDDQGSREIKPISDSFILKESRSVDGKVQGSKKIKVKIK